MTQNDPAPFTFPQFGATSTLSGESDRQLERDDAEAELPLSIELGRTQMNQDVLTTLRAGSVVPLDKQAGSPMDVFVDGRLVARGELLVLENKFCVRITERSQ